MSDVEQRPQPYYDIEIGRIVRWLKANGYTMHVKLNGEVELRKRDEPAYDSP